MNTATHCKYRSLDPKPRPEPNRRSRLDERTRSVRGENNP